MVYVWCVDGGTRFLNVLSLNFLEDIVVVVVSEMSGKKSYFKIDLLSNIYQSFRYKSIIDKISHKKRQQRAFNDVRLIHTFCKSIYYSINTIV